MLKVVQVKIQEQASCKKDNSKFVWFDWSKNRLDWSKILDMHFLLNFYLIPTAY